MKFFFVLFIVVNAFLRADQVLVSIFSEDEYANVERVFSNNKDHIDQIVDVILLNAETKGSLLDIGAGPATITDRLSHFFASTTIVEPNKAFAIFYENRRFNYHIGNFQSIPIEGKYDFVLCSHVLHHVPRHQWMIFLRKMHDAIAPGGKGLVAMVAPKGKLHALRSSINPDYSNSRQVEEMLKQLNISYQLIPTQSVFRVHNYSDFRALVRLFTLDDCYLPEEYAALSDAEKASIDQKIEECITLCKQPDGSFEFSDEDAYILIQ